MAEATSRTLVLLLAAHIRPEEPPTTTRAQQLILHHLSLTIHNLDLVATRRVKGEGRVAPAREAPHNVNVGNGPIIGIDSDSQARDIAELGGAHVGERTKVKVLLRDSCLRKRASGLRNQLPAVADARLDLRARDTATLT